MLLQPSVLLALLPTLLANPVPGFKRESNTTSSTNSTVPSTTASSASTPTATFYPYNDQPVYVTGVSYPAFNQEAYLGIPFAAAPTGSLRFKPPQPATYNTSFAAIANPPGCLQAAAGYPTSEDCLKLNIYKPAGYGDTGPQIPVMVWVYGGSFTSGAASLYNGSGIVAYASAVKQPVIFVALQYRLGLLGFGYGAEIAANGAANLGLRDQIAAMQWVQDNIWAWGGDKSRVTIFGESAGAISIANLYLNPNINLFRSAIMESGAQSTAPLGPTSSTWQAPYDAIVKASNCTPSSNLTIGTSAYNQSTFDCLKALPGAAIINATQAVKALPQYSGSFIFAPSVDGDLIPDSPHTLLSQGKFAKIPFITGNNLDEGTAFTPTALSSQAQIGLLLAVVEPVAPNSTFAAQVLNLYPDVPALGSPFGTGNNTFNLSSVFKEAAAIVGDATFQAPRRWFLQQANQNGLNQTWTYQFEQNSPVSATRPAYLGVYHGSEIPFVFQATSNATGYTAADMTLGRTMLQYWLNFVYYTNPNGQSSTSSAANSTLPAWPAYSYTGGKSLQQLKDGNVTTKPDTYRQTQIDFFNSQPKVLNYRRGL